MEIEPLYSAFLRSFGINTDTRSLQAGQMFWALKGPNFNGNQYTKKALEMPASFVLVDEETGIRDARILKLKAVLIDLQKSKQPFIFDNHSVNGMTKRIKIKHDSIEKYPWLNGII